MPRGQIERNVFAAAWVHEDLFQIDVAQTGDIERKIPLLLRDDDRELVLGGDGRGQSRCQQDCDDETALHGLKQHRESTQPAARCDDCIIVSVSILEFDGDGGVRPIGEAERGEGGGARLYLCLVTLSTADEVQPLGERYK